MFLSLPVSYTYYFENKVVMYANQTQNSVALVQILQEVSSESEQLFGGLTASVLNWKPAPDKWSIAQCLHHLMVTNMSYYPEFDRILQGSAFTNFWGKIPFLPSFFGQMLLKSVDPASARPLKTTPVFTPSSSDLPATIVADFINQQQQTINYYNKLLQVAAPQSVLVTSPAAVFITYSLSNALRIIALHEQRHLNQAKRIMQMPEFPAH
ncbi:DinB family protein [Sphingobacteriales bacterium UPWRP_1]|nr:hypothetical protein B6N25_09835 [Sphingobacteriales bacterium TSM_CSS]PSJ73113.1 DinB family protein [Sphingobacteriales bacterium UPWRP_1]